MKNAVLPAENERDYLARIASLEEIIAEQQARIKFYESQLLMSIRDK